MSAKYNRKDHFYKKAKDEGYRSRAAYKLMELNQRHRIFKKGQKVVDLGSFPGGWLQVAQKLTGPKGVVIGIDLADITEFNPSEITALKSNGTIPIVLKGDITDREVQEAVVQKAEGKVDVVLSDMSHKLTGIKFQDSVRSAELVQTSFDVTSQILRGGGSYVSKIFPSPEADELFKEFRKHFARFSRTCLKSTRASSNEFYFVGLGFKPVSSKEAE